ncbi:MAG: hypothetical protein LUG51_11650 [Tannerellaceae bacterium]|nr:hypothetical protein [Tannerellaceae bacterium]
MVYRRGGVPTAHPWVGISLPGTCIPGYYVPSLRDLRDKDHPSLIALRQLSFANRPTQKSSGHDWDRPVGFLERNGSG